MLYVPREAAVVLAHHTGSSTEGALEGLDVTADG